jgi:hypothetical protein
VADQAGIGSRALRAYFDGTGRLVIGGAGEALLNTADPALAAHFAALPRALQPRDLRLLGPLLQRHAGSPLPDLHAQAQAAGVGPQALAHLFDARAQLLEERVEALPEQQRRALRGVGGAGPAAEAAAVVRPPTTPQVPQHSAPVRAEPPARTHRPAREVAPLRGHVTEAEPTRQAGPTEVGPTDAVPRQPEPSASAVLQFFRRHPRPAQALVDAQAEFRMSRPALLQLLARAGVTELEAYGGRLPDAMELWRRMREGVRRDAQAAAPSLKRPSDAGPSSGPATRPRRDTP